MSTVRETDVTAAPPETRAVWLALPRLLVSPRWRWLTLAVILLAVVLARLGFWQLDRLAQRRARNALLEQRVSMPPIELTGQALDPEEYEYRRVVVSGAYDIDGEVALRNRSRAGLPGVHVLTPLLIDGSDSAVIVDRGWLPITEGGHEARQRFDVDGDVRIEGIVRRPQAHTSPLTPADVQPSGGRLDQWLRPDVAKIAGQLPYPVLPFYVELVPDQGAPELPYAQPSTSAADEGPHLGYAMQWFSFMVILLIGYAAVVTTRSKQQTSEPESATEREA